MMITGLTDEDFDDMHHALGRPKVMANAYRNYFCTPAGGSNAKRFEETGMWKLRQLINEGRDAIYSVTEDGKAALAAWLASRGKRP